MQSISITDGSFEGRTELNSLSLSYPFEIVWDDFLDLVDSN